MANLMRIMLCASLDGRGLGRRMDICVCMAESLQSSPETITMLLIGCSSIQSVFAVTEVNKNKIIF